MGEHDLLAATAVRADDGVAGRWHASLDPGWDTPVGVHGGFLGTVGARAILAEVGDEALVMRTLRVLFLEPPPRALVADVAVLRRGRSSAFVRAVLHGGDPATPAGEVTAVLTADRERPGWLDAAPPTVDRPDASESLADRVARGPSGAVPPLFTHLDERGVLGSLPWEAAWTPGQAARYGRWYRWHEPPRRPDGTLDPIGLIPLADLPGPALWVRCEPDGAITGGLSLDMSIHFTDDPTEEWVLGDTRARWVGRGHVVAETDLWTGDRLVAVSTQTMLQRDLGVLPRG